MTPRASAAPLLAATLESPNKDRCLLIISGVILEILK
ncbi:unnamed protein product [Spirodela intermedia]|uniref:Uncharacterized protein n=2 Tax=Spirodela intermedia TaxID=51605 RepID=A0A7I8K409_SPIIN|nr:unnamed protein product [Spirodela intermedia]CAA6656205.1 unnamed protein product [Spirodela intermedia]CAA7391680.1 unnamed protein product [Spirodela intermedia]